MNSLLYNIQITTHGTTDMLTILYATTTAVIELDGSSYNLKRNNLILCREEIAWHTAKGTVIALNFTSKLFDSLFFSQIAECRIMYDFLSDQSRSHEYLYFSSSEDANAIAIIDLLRKENTKNDEHHEKLIRLLLVGLLTYLDRSRPDTLVLSNSTMISHNRFGRILNYMGAHYADCSLLQIAEEFGYHPDYLSKRFKMITGVTFKEKLLSIRLEKARDLLLTSEWTIEEISREVGFHDKSWFQKKFKEVYGLTPAVYRKKYSIHLK